MDRCFAAAQQPFVARALPINYLSPCSLRELPSLPRQHTCPGREHPRALRLLRAAAQGQSDRASTGRRDPFRCLHSAPMLASPGALHAWRQRRSITELPRAPGSGRRRARTVQAQARSGSEYPPDARTGDSNGVAALATAEASGRSSTAGTGPGALQSPSSGRRKLPLRSLRLVRAQVYLARKQLRTLTLQSLASHLLSLLARWRRVLLGAALLGAVILRLRTPVAQAPVPVAYSTFLNAVSSGCVSSARLEPGSTRVLFNCPPGTTLVRSAATSGSPARPASSSEAPATEAAARGTAASAVAARAGKGPAGAAASQGAAQEAHCWREEVLELSPALGRLILPCPPPAYQFQCHRLAQDDAFLLARLHEHGTPFAAVPRSSTERLTATLAEAGILWLALAPLMALALRMVSGRNGGGNSWRPFDGKKKGRGTGVGFEDVAGVDIAKAELMELVQCLRGGPGGRAASLLGAQLPRGVLLVGPPGTGKTLLARAVAWESGVPFFSASGSEFVELFVGRGAARVRELFSAARRAAPAVVFIDEIDAVGSARGRGNNEEREQTLNQLLTELDGFDTRDDGVLLLAATNRQDVLDPALCRAGRISRRVMVPLPDERGRRDILLVHLRRTACQGGQEGKLAAAAAVAAVTPGFSGAELQNVVNEAALLAAREGMTEVSLKQLVEAVQRGRFGVGNFSGRGGGPLATVATWVQQAALKRLSAPKTA